MATAMMVEAAEQLRRGMSIQRIKRRVAINLQDKTIHRYGILRWTMIFVFALLRIVSPFSPQIGEKRKNRLQYCATKTYE
jgi:hypothetical protein